MAGWLGDEAVVYRDCDFTEADLRGTNPGYSRFERCRFVDSRIDDWSAMKAEFVECVFAGRLVRPRFSGTPWGIGKEKVHRQRNEFRGNDFTAAELDDSTILGGIDLDTNRWPVGDDYVVVRDAQRWLEHVRSRLAKLSTDERDRGLILATVYSSGGFELQRDLLLRRSEIGPLARLLPE